MVKEINNLDFLQNIIDNLPFQIAVLDEEGIIRFINKEWEIFAHNNNYDGNDIGKNYIEITRNASKNDENAKKVLYYLEKALKGENVKTYVEYPCHSPNELRFFACHINSFIISNKPWIVICHENITQRVLAERDKKIYMEQISEIFNNIQEGMVVHKFIKNEKGEIVDYKIVDVNSSFSKFTNLSKDESIGKNASELYKMNPPPYFDIYKRVYETKKAETFEVFYAPMNKYFMISAIPWEDGFVTTFFDISEIKIREIELQKLLNTKNFLLKELEHRTKNSFALVASLIALIMEDYNGETLEVLTKIREQVVLISKIYEILYFKNEKNIEKIDISEVFSQIIENIKNGFKEIFDSVTISLNIENIAMPIKYAQLLGLWFLELIFNAIKYVFLKNKKGYLKFSIIKNNEKIIINYSDGREQIDQLFSPIITKIKSDGFGHNLLQIIAQELKGEQQINISENGVSVELKFSLPEKTDIKLKII